MASKIKYSAMAKYNYHRKRANAPMSKKDLNNKNVLRKVNYSSAFIYGDGFGYIPPGSSSLTKIENSYTTKYEKAAFKRGYRNRIKRDKKK